MTPCPHCGGDVAECNYSAEYTRACRWLINAERYMCDSEIYRLVSTNKHFQPMLARMFREAFEEGRRAK